MSTMYKTLRKTSVNENVNNAQPKVDNMDRREWK